MSKILQRAYFRKQFREAMRNGTKTATTRSSKLGEPGDLFFAHGALFQITSIEKRRLSSIRENWHEEGVSSREDFVRVWEDIHGHFEPDSMWWFHRFQRLPVWTRLQVLDDGVEVIW